MLRLSVILPRAGIRHLTTTVAKNSSSRSYTRPRAKPSRSSESWSSRYPTSDDTSFLSKSWKTTRDAPVEPSVVYELSTIHKDRLTEHPENYADLTGHGVVAVSRVGDKFGRPFRAEPERGSVFPPNTRGHFYYHSPQDAPIAAALRFRLLRSPTTPFNDGKDLLGPSGLPWQIPMVWALREIPELVTLALESGCIDRSFVDRVTESCERLEAKDITGRMSLIHGFGDRFRVRLQNNAKAVYIAQGEKIEKCEVNQLFTRKEFNNHAHEMSKERAKKIAPYDGYALLSFEAIDVPGGSGVALRINEITEGPTLLSPDSRHGIPMPVVGDLVQGNRPGVRANLPRVFRVHETTHGLRLLLSGSPLPPPPL